MKRKPIKIIEKNERKKIKIIEKKEKETNRNKLRKRKPIIPYKMRNVSTFFLERETRNVIKHFCILENGNRNKKQGTRTLPNGPVMSSGPLY